MKLNYFSVAKCSGYRIKIRSQLIGNMLLNIILSVLRLSLMQLGGHICFSNLLKCFSAISRKCQPEWKIFKVLYSISNGLICLDEPLKFHNFTTWKNYFLKKCFIKSFAKSSKIDQILFIF